MTEVKAWKCGFCRKCYARPQSTATHERSCRNNPARKHCKTCVNSYMRRVSSETIDGEKSVPWTGGMAWPTITIHNDVPWCKIRNKAIHEKPYYDECEMQGGDYGPDYPVPGTCDYYAYKGFAGWGEPVYPDEEVNT